MKTALLWIGGAVAAAGAVYVVYTRMYRAAEPVCGDGVSGPSLLTGCCRSSHHGVTQAQHPTPSSSGPVPATQHVKRRKGNSISRRTRPPSISLDPSAAEAYVDPHFVLFLICLLGRAGGLVQSHGSSHPVSRSQSSILALPAFSYYLFIFIFLN
jgi:hypothetical protein